MSRGIAAHWKASAYRSIFDLHVRENANVIDRFTEVIGLRRSRWDRSFWHLQRAATPLLAALAVYTDRPRLFAKIWSIPGVRRHQTGDMVMRAVFPPEALAQVAGVIGAKRKRRLSSEQARRISGLEMLKSVPTPTLKGVSATKEPHVRAPTARA